MTDRYAARDAAVRAAGHDVPQAGTLQEISYCRRCGAPFYCTDPCPGTRPPTGVENDDPP